MVDQTSLDDRLKKIEANVESLRRDAAEDGRFTDLSTQLPHVLHTNKRARDAVRECVPTDSDLESRLEVLENLIGEQAEPQDEDPGPDPIPPLLLALDLTNARLRKLEDFAHRLEPLPKLPETIADSISSLERRLGVLESLIVDRSAKMLDDDDQDDDDQDDDDAMARARRDLPLEEMAFTVAELTILRAVLTGEPTRAFEGGE
jgi:hypothetical protein